MGNKHTASLAALMKVPFLENLKLFIDLALLILTYLPKLARCPFLTHKDHTNCFADTGHEVILRTPPA